MMRERLGFKTAVDGIARRRVTVSAVRFGSQPLVSLKMRDVLGNGRLPVGEIDLSLNQAEALVRALTAALEAAAPEPRRDGPSDLPAARAAAGSDLSHGRDQA